MPESRVHVGIDRVMFSRILRRSRQKMQRRKKHDHDHANTAPDPSTAGIDSLSESDLTLSTPNSDSHTPPISSSSSTNTVPGSFLCLCQQTGTAFTMSTPWTRSPKLEGFQPEMPECWGHRGVCRVEPLALHA